MAASSSSSTVASICTQSNLAPIYGIDRASAVIKFAHEDFEPFAGNFASPMRAQIQRGQSQGLLLTMQHLQQSNNVRVWIGIFFPPAFPARGPQTAVLLAPNQSVKPNHRIVAPNGAVRMEMLDCGPNPQMLLDILVSMIVVLDSDAPVIERGTAGGGGASGQTSMATSATVNSYANNNTNSASAASAGAAAAQQQQSDYSHIQLTPAQQQLHDMLVGDVFQLHDKYLAVRMETMAHEEVLKQTTDALRREAAALQEEIDILKIASSDKAQLAVAIQEYEAGSGNNGGSAVVPLNKLTATDCIEPENDLHGQALDLLATVHAYEDQLDFLEKCLAKQSITSEQYLRYVNTIAREEFQARFLYNRVIDKIQQPKALQTLMRRFNGKGLDEQVIGSVLAANSYSLQKAERALNDMVS